MLNPMRQIAATDTRTWNDANGNLRPELNELGPTSNARFGTVVQSVPVRPGVHRRLRGTRRAIGTITSRCSTSCGRVSACRRTYSFVKNFNTLLPRRAAATQFGRGPDNLRCGRRRTSTSSRSWCPDDPRLPAEIRGQTITGLYVIKDAKRPNVDDYRTYAKNYGDHKETYNGADFNVNWRMGSGGTVGGGMTWGDAHINDCYVVDDPTQLRFCDRTVDPNSGLVRGGLQVKLLGSYPLPGGWQASATFQSVRGPEITAGWTSTTFNNTIRFPNSTRTSLGATPSMTVQLIEPGTLYDDRLYQLDLRGTKTFGRGNASRQADGGSLQRAQRQHGAAALHVRRARHVSPPGPGTWGRPISILEGRLFKIGAQFDF